MSQIEPLSARTVAVLADCHIHPGGGPDWTPRILEALAGAQAILTLGDMGEAAGLDRLETIAPVYGVTGADDAPDPRTQPTARVFEIGGLWVGCIFDPVAAGLALQAEPFAFRADWRARAAELFGLPIDMLLHGSTHRADHRFVDGVEVVDPGSALLPAGQENGAPASFVRLSHDKDGLEVEIVYL
jgi:predicted phosphodiesterase